MALRIPVKLKFGDKVVEVKALLNTGFETDEPVIALPLTVASKLKLPLKEKKLYIGPGKMLGEVFLAEKITVIVEFKGNIESIEAHSIVEPREDEVILSDKAISELGIVIDLKHNKWWIS